FYRGAGYPFARAFLPAQAMRDGALRIEVIEGRYGQVRADGEADLAAGAQRFLGPLQTGDVIEGGALERTALLLDDLPGVRAVPI
ncbi:ShlB/FhaC/HecB family hemolysin secretion/activation protein, partial [Salmonella enterica subsp. enterica serovar Typhimurium]|nr:ShlB/FhaC/HecB family hemolysin secretion/activation protein [Salmonella enterica subsp. enterica serovar Typhimurium]